jgi:hypothetical protein
MVRWIRTRIAWVTALVVLSLSTSEMPHAGAAHYDPDCDLIVVAHDSSAHRVDGRIPFERGRPDHCLACHLGRSFRPGVESSALKAPALEASVALIPDQQFVPGRAPVAQPSLRAPPA